MASSVLGFLMIFLLLILPIAIGIALILTSRRGGLGFPACGACQYDLTGTVGNSERCPECGALYVKVGILPPRGPKKTIRMWTGIAMLAVPLTCFGLAVLVASEFQNFRNAYWVVTAVACRPNTESNQRLIAGSSAIDASDTIF